MVRPPKDIDIELVEPEGGIDPNRLSLALSMLISEKDIIEYFRCQASSPQHCHQEHPTSNKPTRPESKK